MLFSRVFLVQLRAELVFARFHFCLINMKSPVECSTMFIAPRCLLG